LHPYLLAPTESLSKQHLEELLEIHAQPVVLGILRRKFRDASGSSYAQAHRQETTEDLRGDIFVQVIQRLHDLRQGRGNPILNFSAYVAVTSYNAITHCLRKQRPNRYSLENKLRYLLQQGNGLVLWRLDQDQWLCGFAAWQAQGRQQTESAQQRALCLDPVTVFQKHCPNEDATRMNPARLVSALLNAVGHPIAFDHLVGIVAELWGVQDHPPGELPTDDLLSQSGEQSSGHANASPMAEKFTTGQEVLNRLSLRRYWLEIRQLAPKFISALLLQARDPSGNSLIQLFELEGVASLREMAGAMELGAEELAALWDDIPLEDALIASRIGVTSQHVARMRMVARRNLAERLARTND
jgi:hypothetical protein